MKRSILPLLLAASLVTALVPAQGAGASPNDAAHTFQAARRQFLAATAGDTAARDAAIEAFGRLAASQPDRSIHLAYQGAAIALKARDARLPWEKMKFAEQGADLAEKALASLGTAPEGELENIETRAVAASSLLALPSFMHRGAAGKRALQAALDSPRLDECNASVRASVYAAAARLAGNEGRAADEAAWLRKILALPASPVQHERAAARLRELGA